MFKAALMRSKGEGKVGATAICNYAIFLYRNKKDPEQAAKLFCEGIEKFPTHRGIQKNYKAMKRELQRVMAISQSKLPRITEQTIIEEEEEEHERGSSAHLSSRMAGLRAKLYSDVQSADDYKLPLVPEQQKENEEKEGKDENHNEDSDENDDGMLTLTLQKMMIDIHSPELISSSFEMYWLMNAGSGSISDRSYESSVHHSSSLQWDFISFSEQFEREKDHNSSPMVTVTYNDHLCFEFYILKNDEQTQSSQSHNSKSGTFVGSVILPIEDIIHSSVTSSIQSMKLKNHLHQIEETIIKDDGNEIGQINLQLSFI